MQSTDRITAQIERAPKLVQKLWQDESLKKLGPEMSLEVSRFFIRMQAAATLDGFSVASFQGEAYGYAQKYDRARTAREVFTYNTTPVLEAKHAEHAIATAEEFINTIRQLMQHDIT